ncbi:MAG: hypothetical protein QNJ12_22590 [Ilumatobacter sp.]|uniref:hypothetical protein n=1 Tax=Ilumatobacter sp. TaxID=1967498 RepID=UPI002615B7A9|nr:hypothetical protein [Ilumatobacter sp.]MDJ0771591.1 hypothetical protein [Ilumatobacter sp.]
MTRPTAFTTLGRRALALGLFAVAAPAIGLGLDANRSEAAPSEPNSCADDLTAEGLTEFFTSERAPAHGDYQRVLALPDGRAFWTFQDAYVKNTAGRRVLIHNAAMLQTGHCFELLRGGTADTPRPWLFAEQTRRFQHWYWPLGASTTSDGQIGVFVAEMRERGPGYLRHTEPVATWLATVDTDNLHITDLQPAADASASLYGWSVTSDESWTYLYGYCYRQFGWDPLPFAPNTRAHDRACSSELHVARVPVGRLDEPPTYWNGSSWSAKSTEAVPVMTDFKRSINPAEIHWNGERFIAVTKVGDWWGRTVHIDASPTAHGPWRAVDELAVTPVCDRCNTYFASLVPSPASETGFVIGISNNTWDGAHSPHYAPTFLSLDVPHGVSRGGEAAPSASSLSAVATLLAGYLRLVWSRGSAWRRCVL